MQTLVFLLDVDNTLLDNDAIKADWDEQLRVELGPKLTRRFWEIYEQVRKERGVVDIPLALSRLREQTPSTELDEQTYQHIHSLFDNYPFYKRLYPYAIETLEHLRTMGLTVIVSDGDLVFQAEKITKSRLAETVEGRVLLFTHKQEHLDEIARAYPADHYVMIDDNPHILHDSKQIMRDRLTTVFVVQGHYAAGQPPEGFAPDLTVPHIGDLRNYSREQLLPTWYKLEFARLAHSFEQLEQTSSRLALIASLAELLRSIESPDEMAQVCYLLQGRVAPFFEALEIGMAEKTVARSIAIAYHTTPERVSTLYATLGDLGLVAEQLSKEAGMVSNVLRVDDVFQALKTIAQTSGKGTVAKRTALLASLLRQVDSLSAKYIVRIALGNLRLGIGDSTMLDALATAKFHDTQKRKVLEGAYNKTSDLGLIARTLWQHPGQEDALRAVARLDVQVGKPIRSQLAERLPDAETIIKKMGMVDVQYKYDGLRTQIHKDGQQVFIFSRNLENMSQMFPEIIEGTRKQVQADSVILDAETLAYNPASEEFLPFQETTRRRRKYNIEAMAQQLPLKAFVFDILYKNGVSLLEKPLVERMKILEESIQPDDILIVTSQQIVRDAKTLALLFEEAISKGLEGVMVKKPESLYEAGARNFNWVKLKRHSAGALQDTIDCVLLGYIFGRGKRAALGAGALLVGVYDKKQDMFVTVSKIGTGLTDEEWRSIRERTKGLVVDHKPARVSSLIEPSVWLEPKIVIEVLADEITRSPIHTAGKVGDEPGYALRFPRLVAFREQDKKPEDATSVEELIEMYRSQRKK